MTASETYKSHSAFLSLTVEPKGLGFPSQGEGERSCIFFHHKNMILIFFPTNHLKLHCSGPWGSPTYQDPWVSGEGASSLPASHPLPTHLRWA